jgi:uncharacterized protein (DUF433 family)
MEATDWTAHIVLDPGICHGRPTFRGTRVLVSTVLAYLAAGRTPAEIVEDFPSVTVETIRAALAYAADTVGHDRVVAKA